MPYYLQNQAYQFIVHPDMSTWELHSQLTQAMLIKNVRMSLHYRVGRDHVWALENWHQTHITRPEFVTTTQGPSRQITIQIGPDRHQMEFTLLFALPENEPVMMWKIQIHNKSEKPVFIDQIELLNLGFINISHGIHGFSLYQSIALDNKTHQGIINLSGNLPKKINRALADLAFFSNGWQSWSYSGVYRTRDTYQPTRLGFFRRAMIENTSTSRPKRPGLIRSDMFGVLGDLHGRSGLLVGFLSQKNHFGSIETYLDSVNPCLRMWSSGDGAQLDPGSLVETDWACMYHIHLDAPDPFSRYLEAVMREHGLNPSLEQAKTSPKGWCSWYCYSDRNFIGTITPQAVYQNTKAAASLQPEIPLDVIQIDDGFEQNVGDWLSFKSGFSDGMIPISAEIRQAGLKPGLWLAPFIVHPKTHLFRQHPDWILRNRSHRPVNAGFCWNAFTTALDLTKPDALDYCQQVVHRAVHDWGFEYLKLDFLYAAALPGRFHDTQKTRAQVLRSGLQALRSAAGPQVTLLGCGCPLGPAIGLVDSMRIGTDTARSWYPSFQGIKTYFKHDPSMPSARFAIHNALTRSPLHQRWWINDPDCLLVRPSTDLTLEEIQSIASVIALTGGSMFLSDGLHQLPPECLWMAQVLLPLIGKRPYVLDWFNPPTPGMLQLDLTGTIGSWSLLAVFNWQDRPISKDIHLYQTYLDPDKKYLAREFWSGQIYYINDGQLYLDKIPSHGVRLFAIKILRPQHPIYIGSDLHISQGLEVSQWNIRDSQISFCIDKPGHIQGVTDLWLPKPPQHITCGNETVLARSLSDHCYRLEVNTNQPPIFAVSL